MLPGQFASRSYPSIDDSPSHSQRSIPHISTCKQYDCGELSSIVYLRGWKQPSQGLQVPSVATKYGPAAEKDPVVHARILGSLPRSES